MRLRIDICYSGQGYQGWQIQPHTQMTIQEQIQKVLNLKSSFKRLVCSNTTYKLSYIKSVMKKTI